MHLFSLGLASFKPLHSDAQCVAIHTRDDCRVDSSIGSLNVHLQEIYRLQQPFRNRVVNARFVEPILFDDGMFYLCTYLDTSHLTIHDDGIAVL